MRSLRILAASAVLVGVVARGTTCPAADPVPSIQDTLVLTDGRIVDCPRAEKQPDGSYRLKYAHGDIVLPGDLVRVAHVQAAGEYEPKNDTEKANLEKGLVPYEGGWIPKAERDARLAKKAAETKKRVADAKTHREWRNRYLVKTANFEFEYTIDPEIAKNYMDLMEVYYGVFTKDFKVSRPPKEKLKVCFYHDEETFHQVSGAGGGTLAYYLPFGKRRELNFYFERQRPAETTEVMFHEAQHFLSHLLNLNFRIPHNFSEAFAEYYGGSTWDPVKKTMTLGGVLEGRLVEIQADIAKGEKPSLDKFLRNQLGYDDYTWGWSFVHFMMETPRYAAKFKKFYVALPTAKDIVRTQNANGYWEVSGETVYSAFKKYMGIEDTRALQTEWYEYIDTKLKTTSVTGLEDAALSALRTGRFIRGKRLLKEAIDKGSKNPLVYYKYGRLLSGAEAIDAFKKGLEADPLNAYLYVALGLETRALKGEANEKEGVRLIELARDLEPDDVNVWMAVEDALERGAPEAAPTGNEPEDGK